MRAGPLYRFDIGFNLRGNAESKPPTQAGVDAFHIVTDLQVSPHSLPALAHGRNVVRFRSKSKGPLKVRITHRWREIDDRQPPGRVMDGKSAGDNLAPVLKWSAAEHASDYQVRAVIGK